MTDGSARGAVTTTSLGLPLLIALGALTMLGPFGTDAFLPALPVMATELGVTAAQVQLSLTGFTLGMALGQLVVGPLSDGIGRRAPLLVGAALMAVASLGAAAAPTLAVLVACCVATGLGASIGMVVGRAVLSDVAEGAVLTRAFALLGTLTSLGPVLSPVFGVAVMAVWGWRAIFVGLAVISAAALVAVAACVPESHPPHRRIARALRALPANARAALGSRRYLGGATVIWFGFAGQFAYIAGSAFVLQTILGVSPFAYAVIFGVNGCGLIVAGLVTARLSRHWSDRAIMALGLAVEGVGAAVILVTALTGTFTVWTTVPATFLIAASIGLVFGPATSYALGGLRHVAGTALAVLGAVQFVAAGLVSPLVGIGGEDDPRPFAVVIAVSVALAWTGWVAFRPRMPRTTSPSALP